jgi:UPF0176 protein
METKTNKQLVAAFYLFFPFTDYKEQKQRLHKFCKERNIKGTILLAEEGINSTVSGSEKAIHALLDFLQSDPRMTKLEAKFSWYEQSKPIFYRLKIKLKKEIVSLGIDEVDTQTNTGIHVPSKEWNKLIQDPHTIVIDTRNIYETKVGSFEGSLDPRTVSFRQFPQRIKQILAENPEKKVAMFCTGGIRCEKASAYLKQEGVPEVYQLQGGILKYLEEIPPESSLWKGECFVFDNRVTVDHTLHTGHFDLCHACRNPLSEDDKASDYFVPGISCPNCFDDKTEEDRKRFAQRELQITLAKKRGEVHIGRNGS